MKKIILTILVLLLTGPVWAEPIIIDHTAVDLADDIPEEYLDIIKTKLLNVPGQSHSWAYREGLEELETLPGFENYNVEVYNSSWPPATSSGSLRVTWLNRSQSGGWMTNAGEEEFFTTDIAVTLMDDHLSYNTPDYFGWGWCYDTSATNPPSGGIDPVYKVRWGGRSKVLPSNDDMGVWGLDAEDEDLTGNAICMQKYIDAVDVYRTNNPATVSFFTTSPVEDTCNMGESGYQRYLKHEYLRDYVLNQTENGVLFDYADILTHGHNNDQNIIYWTDHAGVEQPFPYIHPDNMQGEQLAHIGMDGCVRIAKALWVMMARIEGWDPDGGEPPVNNAPYPPNNPNPQDGANNINIDLNLAWSCNDPDNDTLTYDVYFGTSNPPSLVASNLSLSEYNLSTELEFNTNYYWRVVASDGYLETAGPLWNFTTRPKLYAAKIKSRFKHNGELYFPKFLRVQQNDEVTLNVHLDNQEGDTDTFDICAYLNDNTVPFKSKSDVTVEGGSYKKYYGIPLSTDYPGIYKITVEANYSNGTSVENSGVELYLKVNE